MSTIACINVGVECSDFTQLFNLDTADYKITSICTTFHKPESNKSYQVSIHCGKHVYTDDVIDQPQLNELGVMRTWIGLMKLMNPQIIVSWNLFDFDYSCIRRRSETLGILEELVDIEGSDEEVVNEYWIKGKINKVDLMKFVRVEHKIYGKFTNVLPKFGIEPKFKKSLSYVRRLGLDSESLEHNFEWCRLYAELFDKLDVINKIGLMDVSIEPIDSLDDDDAVLCVEI